mgnify:CR=1 FL=1
MTEQENKMLILIKEMYEYYNKDSLTFARRIVALEQDLGIVEKAPKKVNKKEKFEQVGGELKELDRSGEDKAKDLPINPFEDNKTNDLEKQYDKPNLLPENNLPF